MASGDRGRGLSVLALASEVRPARDFARSCITGIGGTGGGRDLVGDKAAALRAGMDILAPRARFRIESAWPEGNCENAATDGFFCKLLSLT